MRPGEYLLDEAAGEITANRGRETRTVEVRHTGDRPIQVGSHFHFFETNRALEFDRPAAYGMRLDIAAGTAVRFEPGDAREVRLVALGGDRVVLGHSGLVEGPLDDPAVRRCALDRMERRGFRHLPPPADPVSGTAAAGRTADKAIRPTADPGSGMMPDEAPR